jgi:hypothetical protein
MTKMNESGNQENRKGGMRPPGALAMTGRSTLPAFLIDLS